MDEDIEIVVGTYEDYMIGYRRVQSSLDQTFAVRCHSGSVKALTCSPNGCFILSAGYDDTLNVLNMKRRKLVCTLEGAVSCAKFVGNAHVVCGSEDGNIYIYECKQDVTLRKTLRGHKGPVIALDTHPSSKVLLSLSKDGTMRTWNLVKARCAYVTRIKHNAQYVRWSKVGDKFVVATTNEIQLYNSMGAKESSTVLETRISCVEFIGDNMLATASSSGVLDVFDLKLNHQFKVEAHESRIKSIVCLRENASKEVQLATASSDGKIKVWSCLSKTEGLMLLAETDTGARLTCASASVVKCN